MVFPAFLLLVLCFGCSGVSFPAAQQTAVLNRVRLMCMRGRSAHRSFGIVRLVLEIPCWFVACQPDLRTSMLQDKNCPPPSIRKSHHVLVSSYRKRNALMLFSCLIGLCSVCLASPFLRSHRTGASLRWMKLVFMNAMVSCASQHCRHCAVLIDLVVVSLSRQRLTLRCGRTFVLA